MVTNILLKNSIVQPNFPVFALHRLQNKQEILNLASNEEGANKKISPTERAK